MKKGLKIAFISFGSLLGLVVITVCVACWLVFTPARLTSIVNSLSEKYLLCESHFDKVDLTLFKTFPDAGLEVHNVVLINPYTGAPSDTLASIGSLTVGLNVRSFLKSRQVEVHQVRVDDPMAHLYIGSDGTNNFTIMQPSSDTTKSKTELPELIQMEKVSVNNLCGTFTNEPQHLYVEMEALNLGLGGTLKKQTVDATLKVDSRCLLLHKSDSADHETFSAVLDDLDMCLSTQGNTGNLTGQIDLTLPDGNIALGGKCYTPEAMRNAKGNLLTIKAPFKGSVDSMQVVLSDAFVQLLDYRINLSGDASLAREQRPLTVDVQFATNTWQVADLLAVLPEQFTKWQKNMTVDSRLDLKGSCVGTVTDTTKPVIDADITISKGVFSMPKVLPNKVKQIEADLSTHLDLVQKTNTTATVRNLKARMGNNDIALSGKVTDLLGVCNIDAHLLGDLSLDEVRELLPDKLPLTMKGNAAVDINVKSALKNLTKTDLTRIHANGTLKFQSLDARYDSIYATAPRLDLAFTLPVSKRTNKVGELLGAHITGHDLHVIMSQAHLDAMVVSPDLDVNLNNLLDKNQPLAAAFNINLGTLNVNRDSLAANASKLALQGSIRYDKSKENILAQLDPNLDVALADAHVSVPSLPNEVRMPDFRFAYSPRKCQVTNANILWGKSDYQLYGTINNLEKWLSHERSLYADLNFVANNADIDELLSTLSGMGRDKDSLEQMRKEDKVPSDANPFIVPMDVDATLHTHIKRCVAFGNVISDMGGTVMVKDGVAVLDQMGFVCRAARMQLTALYKSPRPNNLFASIDFHLLDIQVHELLQMVPCIDTLVPMLASFDGNANFHLAGESFLDARYKPKMSSLLGSAAISGQDLVVLDDEKTASMLKLLQVKDWRQKDNKLVIDSLSVEMTAFRKEIEVFPFLINVGKYAVCASGKHTLDNVCNYHLELLKSPLPFRLGIDVKGSIKKPNISLGSVQYADLYNPEKRGAAEEQTLKLKRMIREALESNVR